MQFGIMRHEAMNCVILKPQWPFCKQGDI